MRKKNTITNAIWAGGSYLFIFVLGLITRKAFIQNLGGDILGYEAVFSSVFSLLSVTELGVGTVISYSLYREIALNNKASISKFMASYRTIYRMIGFVILVLGVMLSPFILFLFEGSVDCETVYLVYFFGLFSLVINYLVSTQRLVFLCDQKNYICVRIDFLVSIASGIIKLVAIIAFKSIIVYFLAGIVGGLISNFIISQQCYKKYKYIDKHETVTTKEMREMGIFKDAGMYTAQRIACAVYGGSDNIIVSSFLGVSPVFLISNYYTIEQHVTSFLDKVTGGLQSSIGNAVYDPQLSNQKRLFDILNQYSYLLASFIALSYFCLLQSFIVIWIGEDYVLSLSFLAFFSLNQFVAWNHRVVGYYRTALGKFDKDIIYMAIGATANILLSMFGALLLGVTGVVMATFASHIILWFGRSKVVFDVLFNKKHFFKYWKGEVLKFLYFLIKLTLSYVVCRPYNTSFFECLIRFGVMCIGLAFLDAIVFRNSEGFQYAMKHLKRRKKGHG